jgi:hypothetical protein
MKVKTRTRMKKVTAMTTTRMIATTVMTTVTMEVKVKKILMKKKTLHLLKYKKLQFLKAKL